MSTQPDPRNLTLPFEASHWTKDPDPVPLRAFASRLRVLGGITINGQNLHVEAFRVQWAPEGAASRDEWHDENHGTACTVEAFDPLMDEELEWMCDQASSPPETVELEGWPGRWVILCIPHAE